MKLKHLTIRGFKSFADRTRLDFSTGINVVVGPNGSGKSNILDAIAWVMGTQGTRVLRTEKMEDVVFAGTETRPPLSRAEVSLTFANDEQLMPLALAEITITRRIFRDGTSEYELNGAPCRLLDIQELLSDGGIGRQQHVLVNQGQVGEVLNAKPEDHRAVIEEAAGVTKHRSRRDRAVRRLERTDHDVERLNDILGEKRKAMRPLKRQANAAERHDSVRDEARALTLWIGAEELRAIRKRMADAEVTHAARKSERDEADGELTAILGSLDGLRQSAGEVGSHLSRDTAAAARLETVRERLRRIGLVARERRRSISAKLEGADERRDDLELEQRDLLETLNASIETERVAREHAERADASLRALEDEERALAEQIQLPAEGVVANLRGDLRSLETAEQRDIAEAAQVRARLDVVQQRIAEEQAESERLNGAIEATDSAVTLLGATYSERLAQREAAQVGWESDEASVAELRLAAAGGRARVEALESAMAGLVDERATAIASEAEGVVGSLVAALDVPPDLADAVDAALGIWRGAYVTADMDSVRSVAHALKAAATGGLSLLTASEPASVGSTRDVAKRYGVDAMIDVLGTKADADIAAVVVGDVVVVQGWMAGWEIVSVEPGIRAVTPEGDVISRTGIWVAQPDGAGPAALEVARIGLEGAESELVVAERQMHTSRRRFDQARAAERTALENLEAEEAKLAGLTEALALTGRARTESIEEAGRLNERLEAIREVGTVRQDRIGSLRDRMADFQGEEAARQAAWDALNERRSEVATKRDEARTTREEATGDVASIVERRRITERRLEVVAAELAQLKLLPDTDDSVDALEMIEKHADRVVGVVGGHIETLRVRQRELRDQVGSANAELTEAEDRREFLESKRRAAAETVQELEIELAELRIRDQSVVEGLRRDADADESAALAADQPIVDVGDPKARLASLQADLRRMGPINPLAAHEYSELSAEVDELEAQLGDLNDSRREIRKVITALDEQMEMLFTDAFAEIAAFYEENFTLVFPGGNGRLRLTETGEPLTAGVLVEAQPAGKKVGKLSLLSGGERSLAALAFLFAVFRARPSPFYVLDEVEAALDDANLHRFLRLVDTLRSEVQLVIITHQQQTMQAADVLYGVTMEPGESSKILSKRMSPINA